MAKAAAKPDTSLLDALRKALVGPKPLQGKDGLFPPGAKGKPAADSAIEQGYLILQTTTIPPKSKKGKPKEEVLAVLTEKGRQHVLNADSPKAILEALLPGVQSLATASKPPPADFGFVRPELEKATAACVKAIEDALAALQKTVQKAFTNLEQAVTKALPAPSAGAAALDPGPVLLALQAALARLSAPAPSPVAATTPAPAPLPSPPAPVAVSPPLAPAVLTQDQLRTALHEAYNHLCRFVEFRDKLVEIPPLFKELSRRMPGLSVEQFHRELESLSDERKIELHKLNEVHQAKDRHLAIEKDDRLYYYVFWK